MKSYGRLIGYARIAEEHECVGIAKALQMVRYMARLAMRYSMRSQSYQHVYTVLMKLYWHDICKPHTASCLGSYGCFSVYQFTDSMGSVCSAFAKLHELQVDKT